MARPTKLTPITAATAATLARLGFTDEKLAAALGVSRSTVSLWKRADPSFSDSLKSAKSQADAKVMDSLYHRAIGFTAPDGSYHAPHPTAIIFYLKNRMPGEWRDITRSEISGVDGAPIQTAAPMVQLSDTQDQALMRVIEDAQQRVKLQSPTHL
jgi:hypothetical protein